MQRPPLRPWSWGADHKRPPLLPTQRGGDGRRPLATPSGHQTGRTVWHPPPQPMCPRTPRPSSRADHEPPQPTLAGASVGPDLPRGCRGVPTHQQHARLAPQRLPLFILRGHFPPMFGQMTPQSLGPTTGCPLGHAAIELATWDLAIAPVASRMGQLRVLW